MNRLLISLAASLALIFAPLAAWAQSTVQVTYKVVTTCGSGVTYTAGKMNFPTIDVTGVVCTNSSGGGGGSASFTAAATPFSVTAGVNKPAAISTTSSAQWNIPVKPGTTTEIDLSLPSGVLGVDAATIASLANPLPTSSALVAGTALAGKFGIDQTTIGTTNGVREVAGTTGGATPISKAIPANTTSVAICASACTLYSVYVQTISATPLYLKLYNTAQGSVTCGTPTPVDRIMIPASATGAGAVIPIAGGVGAAYGTALTACVTTGIADNDTGAPTVSQTQISYYVK